jgi:probable regulatory domain-containing protein
MAEIPLKPLVREDIRKLELGLIFGTLFRPDVIERIKNAEDRLTWLDSLVVAAASLARERAGYPVSRIAEEVGRTESTVRNHLEGKTEAGKLVKETFNLLVKSGGKLELKLPPELAEVGGQKLVDLTPIKGDVEAVKEGLKAVEDSLAAVESKIQELKKAVENLENKLTS